MKIKKLTAGILAIGLCLPMLTGCGSSSTGKEASSASGSSNPQENVSENSSAEPHPATAMHTLMIRDSLKNDSMTATFLNSVTGATEDIAMTKTKETDDSFIYTCQADTNLYNMVHLNYGNRIKSKNVSFNSYVAGWYLKDDEEFSYDPLLPYAEGMDLSYDPKFDTKTFTFEGNEKKVYIWTPDDYDAKAEDKYSTIYLLDGQTVLATGKDRGMDNDVESWNVAESVTGMMSVTDNKAIIVAIVTDGERRDHELIPDIGELYNDPDTPEEYLLKSEKRGNAFADFICDTIMPYVQENYNVYTDARHTALAGSSFGGVETFYAVMAHPDKFGTGGVLSATLDVYDDATWRNFLSDKVKNDNAPFIYFYAGAFFFDNGDHVNKMYNRLTDMGYPKEKMVFDKNEPGMHTILWWRNIFSEFLQAFFMQKVEGLEFGAKIDYIDKTDMRKQVVTEIKIDKDDPRLNDKYNFVYYDNSETKWDEVYVYWWGDDGFATNIITGTFYERPWPGVKMEKIEGTDIYRAVAAENANKIIFNSGFTDEEIIDGKTGYQTKDLKYKSNENTGKVYKIDLSVPPKSGKGINKTKHVYGDGSWSDVE